MADALLGIVVALIPASVGVAILKYRLYDIDVVIKKTVVFTVVASVLTALYLGVIALATVGTVSRVVVGIVLLVVTFNPVRRAARSLADRLVYGRRATSYEVLADFSEHMAETYATDDVLPRMAQILAGATGATRATVWLLVGGELRPAATSGGDRPERSPRRETRCRRSPTTSSSRFGTTGSCSARSRSPTRRTIRWIPHVGSWSATSRHRPAWCCATFG